MNRYRLISIISLLLLLWSSMLFAASYELQYKCGNTAASSTSMNPHFIVANKSGASIAASAITVRYYYIKEGTVGEQGAIDYAPIGNSNVTITFMSGYIEFGFTAGAGTIANNATTGEIQSRISKTDWSYYDQSNDCCFSPSITAYTLYDKMAVYVSGVLVYGSTCSGSTSAPTATRTVTATTVATRTATSTTGATRTVTATTGATRTATTSATATRTATSGATATRTATSVGTATRTVTATASATPTRTATPTGGGNFVWVEAENGAAYYPMVVKSDTYNDTTPTEMASNEIYLGVAGYGSSTTIAPVDGNINYKITNLSGTYNIWARVNGPWSGSSKFWYKLDNTTFVLWDAGVYGSWQWKLVMQGDLTGRTSFSMAYAENRGMLDKLLFTNNLTYVPSGLGDNAIPSYAANNYVSTAVSTYGQLQVIGRYLCSSTGAKIQLRGIGTHGLQWFPPIKDRTIPDLAQSFPFNATNKTGLSLVRLAMYVEDFWTVDDFWNGYLADPTARMAFVKNLVSDAISAGVYVIVDWHIHQNPQEVTKYNLQANAEAFFVNMAQTYGNTANIIWEICNEPVGSSDIWASSIKPYAEYIIPKIRQYSSNIIIVGTSTYSQDVEVAAANPITGYSNIMYTLHFYAASHDYVMAKVTTAVNLGLPIFCTEWGTSDYAVSYNDYQKAQTWFDTIINPYFISWCNWSLSPKHEASSVLVPDASLAGLWADANLTESGKWVRDKLNLVVPAP